MSVPPAAANEPAILPNASSIRRYLPSYEPEATLCAPGGPPPACENYSLQPPVVSSSRQLNSQQDSAGAIEQPIHYDEHVNERDEGPHSLFPTGNHDLQPYPAEATSSPEPAEEQSVDGGYQISDEPSGREGSRQRTVALGTNATTQLRRIRRCSDYVLHLHIERPSKYRRLMSEDITEGEGPPHNIVTLRSPTTLHYAARRDATSSSKQTTPEKPQEAEAMSSVLRK